MVILDDKAKKEIVQAITDAERLTSGEIRVHIQKKCKHGAFEHAKKVFHKLRMHKTKLRNGVLIFVALDSKELAIVGDRAIHEKVGDAFWQNTRDLMLEYFKQNKPAEGIVRAVLKAGEKLRESFPLESGDKNELSNQVTTD